MCSTFCVWFAFDLVLLSQNMKTIKQPMRMNYGCWFVIYHRVYSFHTYVSEYFMFWIFGKCLDVLIIWHREREKCLCFMVWNILLTSFYLAFIKFFTTCAFSHNNTTVSTIENDFIMLILLEQTFINEIEPNRILFVSFHCFSTRISSNQGI